MPLLPSFAPLPSATPPMPPGGALSQAIRPLAGQAARNTTLFQPAKAKLPATAKAPAAPAAPKVFDAAAMQRFLNAKGFAIPVDGVNGPLTQAAGAAFRSHADPQAFNVGHNLTAATSPGTAAAGAGAPPARVAIPASVTGQYKQPAAAAPHTGGGAPVLPSSVFTQPAAGASNTGAAGASSGHGTSSSGAVTDPALAAIQTLIKQAQQGALAQGRQGQSLINGYSTSAQNELKGIDFGQPYQQAAGEQNAINTALMSALQGQGGTLQDQLGAQLAASGSGAGSPLSAALTGALGTSTAGASAANLAGGDAQLSSIIQSGQAARNYGNSLPGITALAGLQDTKALQGSVGANEAKTVAGLEAKVPGLLQSETAANTRAAEFASTAKATAAYRAAQIKLGNTKEGLAALALVTKEGTNPDGTLNSVGSAIFASLGQKVPPGTVVGAPKGTKPIVFGSDKGGRYSLDPTTGQTTMLVAPVITPTKPIVVGSDKSGRWSYNPTTGATVMLTPPVKSSAKTGGMTAGELSTLTRDTAAAVAKGASGKAATQTSHWVAAVAPGAVDPRTGKVSTNGSPGHEVFTAVPGTGSSTIPYSAALATAIAGGPSTPVWRAKATQIVNANPAYAMGSNGRPYEGRQAMIVARQFVTEALKNGQSMEKAIAQGRATGLIPDTALLPAARSIYAAHAKKSSTPVAGVSTSAFGLG